MASVRNSIHIDVPPGVAWDALRDVGNVHTRLAPAFVTNCVLEDGVRQVTFADGTTIPERIVAVDEDNRRVVWTIEVPRYRHHNGAATVEPSGDGTLFTWVADLLPDELAQGYAEAIDHGLAAIKAHLESS